ncbi:MAG: CDGSH iron-sulfur domain-containing protein [Vicinamibacterales bacterium]
MQHRRHRSQSRRLPVTPPADGPPGPAVTIRLRPGGPYVVEGPARVIDGNGVELTPRRLPVALCRCARTGTPPFCDGSHRAEEPGRAACAAPAAAAPADAAPPEASPPHATPHRAGADRLRQGTATPPAGEGPGRSAAGPQTPSVLRSSGRE